MTGHEPRNVAASVRQRLLNLARQRGEDFQWVLVRFGLERLLYRLGQSQHRSRFVLKGAMLFQAWIPDVHRATRDLDLLGSRAGPRGDLKEVFRDICSCDAPDDGLEFRTDDIRMEPIAGRQDHEGVRVRLMAMLDGARIPLQIDVGYGKAVYPPAETIEYPTILSFPAPTVRAYPKEALIAEKFHAAVILGMANSRVKDFYDMWVMSTTFEFCGSRLAGAMASVFDGRDTEIPRDLPVALSREFSQDPSKLKQWQGFLRRHAIGEVESAFPQIVSGLRSFLMPVCGAILSGEAVEAVWHPPGPWRTAPIEESRDA